MKRFLKLLTTNNAKTSAIFYVGSFALNIGNYFFHFVLLKMLNPPAYGEFLSYLSLLYLLTIPSGTISMLVTKYVSDYSGRGKLFEIKKLFYYLIKRVLLPGIFIATLTILASGYLAYQLKSQPMAFIILGLSIIISFFGAVVGAYLMALHKFIRLICISSVEIVIKISLAIGLIYCGFGAVGAVIALVIASLSTVSLSFLSLRSYLKLPTPPSDQTSVSDANFSKLLIYYLILSGGSLSLISTDVLLVRHFFNPHDSGIYSALSILGRMIFFGLTPLISLIIPMVSFRFASQVSTKPIILKLGAVMVILGSIGVSIFSIFPNLIITLLSGPQYLEASGWLPWFATAMLLFALNRLGFDYFMAVSQPKATFLLLIATVAQPIAITLFHNSLEQIVKINITIQLCLLLGLFGYHQFTNMYRKIKP